MGNTFKPKFVSSDVIARWPAMACQLWKRAFWHQASVLLCAALLLKVLPAWSAIVGFVLAPSLFLLAFAAVQIADERKRVEWRAIKDLALPGAIRISYISLRFAACFGAAMAVLYSIAQLFVPKAVENDQASPHATIGELASVQGFAADSAFVHPTNLAMEFFHFCATWTEGVIAMLFLGIFIVAIYQGIFGIILHGQEGVSSGMSRAMGWQAWQINSESIEKALKEAPPKFFKYVACAALAIVCTFQSVYLSPLGLLFATYIPSLVYVAYRSIFFGKHENSFALQAEFTPARTALIPVKIA